MRNGFLPFCLILMALSFLVSCNEKSSSADSRSEATFVPRDMDVEVERALIRVLSDTANEFKRLSGADQLMQSDIVSAFYRANDYTRIWSMQEKKKPLADTLLYFIESSRNLGLYPDDYHFRLLSNLHSLLDSDSLAVKNSVNWTQLEVFSSDAFFRLLKDLKEGRLMPDSSSIVRKKNYVDSFFVASLNEVSNGAPLPDVLKSAEPTFFKYRNLREALPAFVRSMDTTRYAQIIYPYEDSIAFIRAVYARLLIGGFATKDTADPDAATFSAAVKKYQAEKKLTADGKPGARTIRELNITDEMKFRSIAVSLDRYKQLPAMPETFIWVNIPSMHLQVFSEDTLSLVSRIIVGKPATPTPELTSRINNLVVYPNWTIPASIIRNEILPALKKNPDYLSQKGYNLFDEKGGIINPYGINWARYNTGIPWRVVQGSGDDNALGVFKFNFNNPYSVYLHDTNQRYLFANEDRALSHGCVRVQKWQQLAALIAGRDSAMAAPTRLNYSEDSLKSWVSRGVRKTVTVRNRFPLYIVYVTAESNGDSIDFYSDIYNEDARLYEQYFRR